jgi:hypothetical protein
MLSVGLHAGTVSRRWPPLPADHRLLQRRRPCWQVRVRRVRSASRSRADRRRRLQPPLEHLAKLLGRGQHRFASTSWPGRAGSTIDPGGGSRFLRPQPLREVRPQPRRPAAGRFSGSRRRFHRGALERSLPTRIGLSSLTGISVVAGWTWGVPRSSGWTLFASPWCSSAAPAAAEPGTQHLALRSPRQATEVGKRPQHLPMPRQSRDAVGHLLVAAEFGGRTTGGRVCAATSASRILPPRTIPRRSTRHPAGSAPRTRRPLRRSRSLPS